MPTAYANATEVKFPPRCIGCDRAHETMHTLQARRGIDLLVLSHFEFIDIPVPVCRRCRRRRRIAGVATYVGVILFVIIGGFIATTFVLNEWKVAGALLGATALVVALGLRVRGDALIQWATLGVTSDWLRGEGKRLRMNFRRELYFADWLSINPGAALDAAPMTAQQFLEENPPMNSPSMNPPIFSRLIPAISLSVTLLLLGGHHWYAVTYRNVYASAVLLLTMFGGLALGGTIYAPLFYSLGARGRQLPVTMKVGSGLCVALGGAVGFYLLFIVYAS